MDSITCKGCGQTLEATEQYFRRYKRTGKLSGKCWTCIHADNHKWKQDNKEHYQAWSKQYNRDRWEQNKDELKARHKTWREANLDYSRQRVRDYYHANKDKERARHNRWRRSSMARKKYMQAYGPAYRRKNRDKLKEKQHLYNQRRPEVMRAAHLRRKALKRNAPGHFTAKDIQLMYKNQKGKCWYCQADISNGYHIEHRIPLSRGGSNDPNNLVLSCAPCNLAKHNRLPHEWSDRLL